jgi:hypothetical protein
MSARGILRAVCMLLVSLWLNGCVEGATTSGSGDNTGLAVSAQSQGASRPALTVSTESLSFVSQEGSGAPAAQLFTGQISEGLTKPPYIDVAWTGNGLASVLYDHTNNALIVSVTPKAPAILGVGTFTDQVVINACEDSRCRRHLDGSPKTVSVTYTVRNRLTVYPAALSYAHVLGSHPLPGSKALTLQGTMVNWAATADASWIQLASGSGTTPDSLEVGINTSGLAAGNHHGNVTLTNNDTGESMVVPVAMQVSAPTLSSNPLAMAFSGLEGRYLPGQPLVLSLNTGSSAYEWTASVETENGQEWLMLSSASGTVSSSPTALAVSVNTAGLPGGTYSGSLTFTTSVAGMELSRTVPVTLSLATPLWVADNGVALVSTPSLSKLSHTVKVLDRWETSTTAWTATSDEPWLSVTSGGTSGGNLTVTANPAGLAPNTVHYARVTVGFGGNPPQGKEIIEVGLWVGDSATSPVNSITGTFQAVETDPVRPYAYVHNGGGTLHVYNVYTASLVTSITGVANSIGSMTISSDGSTLYVLDSVLPRRIVPVNLSTLTAGTPWALNESNYSETTTAITYARPNGQGVILANSGRAFDVDTGMDFPNVVGNIPYYTTTQAASLDGSLFCSLYGGSYYYYYELYCFGLRYTELDDGTLSLTSRPSAPYYAGTGGVDLAISNDGSRVYVAANSPYAFNVYNGQSMELLPPLTADTNPNAIEVGPDNRIYGTARALTGAKDLWVYDGAGVAQGSFRLAGYGKGVLNRQLKLSGDGKRMVVLTDDPSLKFATGL